MSPHVVPFGAPIPNPGWPEPGLPRRHTSTSAYARRPAEDIHRPFPGPGALLRVFYSSVGQGQPESFHNRREGGGGLGVVGVRQFNVCSACSLSVIQGGSARA